MQVYVKRFPGGEGKWQVSVDGGYWPQWSAKGDELFFVSGDELLVVDVEMEPTFRLGSARVLFTRPTGGTLLPFSWPDGFAVSEDGQRFVMMRTVDRDEQARTAQGITVVQNWFAEFRRE
jgi:hypothetical protein